MPAVVEFGEKDILRDAAEAVDHVPIAVAQFRCAHRLNQVCSAGHASSHALSPNF